MAAASAMSAGGAGSMAGIYIPRSTEGMYTRSQEDISKIATVVRKVS